MNNVICILNYVNYIIVKCDAIFSISKTSTKIFYILNKYNVQYTYFNTLYVVARLNNWLAELVVINFSGY